MRTPSLLALGALAACETPNDDYVLVTHADLAGLQDQIDTLAAQNEALQAELAVVRADLDQKLTADDLGGYATETWVVDQGYGLAADIATLATNTADLTQLETDVTALEADVAVIASDYLMAVDLSGYATESWVGAQGYSTIDGIEGLADYLRVDTTTDEVVFEGANVFVQSGSGTTDGAVNGLGNLFVGYNETSTGPSQSGSHNLIVGRENEFTSYGGLVVGWQNSIQSQHASVLGGSSNEAAGDYSVVVGGVLGGATGAWSLVAGGSAGTASGGSAAVLGGEAGAASGSRSVVVGGFSGEASGSYSLVLGGDTSAASATYQVAP
jgi:hypothetical protein